MVLEGFIPFQVRPNFSFPESILKLSSILILNSYRVCQQIVMPIKNGMRYFFVPWC